MHRFMPSLTVRMYRDLCWYIRFFISSLPDIMAGAATVSLIILLPIMAAFAL